MTWESLTHQAILRTMMINMNYLTCDTGRLAMSINNRDERERAS